MFISNLEMLVVWRGISRSAQVVEIGGGNSVKVAHSTLCAYAAALCEVVKVRGALVSQRGDFTECHSGVDDPYGASYRIHNFTHHWHTSDERLLPTAGRRRRRQRIVNCERAEREGEYGRWDYCRSSSLCCHVQRPERDKQKSRCSLMMMLCVYRSRRSSWRSCSCSSRWPTRSFPS